MHSGLAIVARAVCVFATTSCAAGVQQALPIGVIVDGDPAAIGPLPTVDGLAVHAVAMPAPPSHSSAIDTAAAAATRGRAAFAAGDLDACRAELRDVDLTAVLAAGDRPLAARALAFDAACAWGGRHFADAQSDAAKFAALELEIPAAAVPPDVEEQIGSAIAAAGSAPTSTVAVTGPVGARLHVDGRADGCALPCETPPLAPGDHVFALEADGDEPHATVVDTTRTARIALTLSPATPALAAQQWRARVGRGLPAADATGASLIARFGGERRLAWMHGDRDLEASLIVDGQVVAHAVGARGDSATVLRDLAYDGHVLVRPPVWKRPWFWIAVSAAAVAISGVVVVETYTPTKNTSGGF